MESTPEIIRIVQRYLTFKKLNPGAIDGIAGKKTYAALDKLKDLPKSWKDERKLVGAIQLYAKEQGLDPGPIDGLWGQCTQLSLEEFYGKAKPTGNKNLTTFAISYPIALTWDTSKKVTKITAHVKVKDSVLRVLNKVHDYFSKCFNYYVMRGSAE
ncbi:hypothetical protein GN157_01625 [Flavobacterium rakeshii]|uniref:Peptidoglycan binding-like domain-containing protein n=1 Tax=Flavobacterium rakeshii TaxID=1038845 RepID=A0A6N8H6Z8_9FLAO|nr:hypothetical protein [Flavobacterium rakeshii]MUV02394.1 hypothetical protein [Flavobacterium rakeshii]